MVQSLERVGPSQTNGRRSEDGSGHNSSGDSAQGSRGFGLYGQSLSEQAVLLRFSSQTFSLVLREDATDGFQARAQWPLVRNQVWKLNAWPAVESVDFLLDLGVFSKCLKAAADGTMRIECRARSTSQQVAGRSRFNAPARSSSGEGLSDQGTGLLASKRRRAAVQAEVSGSSFDGGQLEATQFIMTSERENMQGKKIKMTQTMPVYWLTADSPLLAAFREPMISLPRIQLMLPNVYLIRSVLERLKGAMKHAQQLLYVTAKRTSLGGALEDATGPVGSREEARGSLSLGMSSVTSSLDVHFSELSVIPLSQALQQEVGQDVYNSLESTLVLSYRDLMRCFQCHILHPKAVIIGFVENQAAVVYVHWPPALVTYYLPHKHV